VLEELASPFLTECIENQFATGVKRLSLPIIHSLEEFVASLQVVPAKLLLYRVYHDQSFSYLDNLNCSNAS